MSLTARSALRQDVLSHMRPNPDLFVCLTPQPEARSRAHAPKPLLRCQCLIGLVGPKATVLGFAVLPASLANNQHGRTADFRRQAHREARPKTPYDPAVSRCLVFHGAPARQNQIPHRFQEEHRRISAFPCRRRQATACSLKVLQETGHHFFMIAAQHQTLKTCRWRCQETINQLG